MNNEIQALDFSNIEQLDKMQQFASIMAKGTATLPDYLRDKPGDCLAICLQTLQWGLTNPYTVANQAFFINGKIGYSSQLISAVVQSSDAIKGNFKFEYSEGWSKVQGVLNGKNPAWNKEDEKECWVKVGAVLKGEDEITWGQPQVLSGVVIRNSPLWVTDPQQQLTYLAVKKFTRIHTPAVLMGVYSREDLEDAAQAEKEINPSMNDIMEASKAKEVKPEPDEEAQVVEAEVVQEEQEPKPDPNKVFSDLMGFMANAKTLEDLDGVLDTIALKLDGKVQDRAVYAFRKRDIQLTIAAMEDPENFEVIYSKIKSKLDEKDAEKEIERLNKKCSELIGE